MTVTGMATSSLPSRSLNEDRGGFARARSALGWILLALVLAAWAVTLRPGALGGPATYVVVSGDSMEPVFSDGDLAVVRERDEYSIGDIIVFPVPEGHVGAGTLVIHRIVGAEGEAFVPQGDNRDRVDEWRPTIDDIRGSLWIHLPSGGRLLMNALQPPIVAALAGGLMTMWVLTRDSAKTDNDQEQDDEERQVEDGRAGEDA